MSGGTLFRIADQVINRPLLILPEKLALVSAVLGGRIGLDAAPAEIEAALAAMPGASRFVGSSADEDPSTGRRASLPYRRTEDGTAIITITGSLVNRGAWVGASSGLTSYEGVKFQIGQAVADPKTTAIVLDIESPGGQAIGAFEVADAVRAAAAQKPVTAVVNGMAASAAYAIASGATRIVTTPSGMSGSIGVVMMHADYSRALDREGITPTLIHAGAHKVDANPFEPLSADVRADLQAEIEQLMTMFVDTVAAGRRGLDAKAIRATEARTFIGQAAVDAGLADAVGTFDSVLTDASRGRGRTTPPKGTRSMSSQDATFTQADLDRASADAGRAAQTRISGILGHAEADGRGALAQHFAFETDMSVEAAGKALARSPKETAAAAAPGQPTLEERGRAGAAVLSSVLPDPAAEAASGKAAGGQTEKKATIDTTGIYAARRTA